MNEFGKDVHFDLIMPRQKVVSQKQVFQILAHKASQVLSIPEQVIFQRLADKESTASSGIGNGVSIPHFKMQRAKKPLVMLATLENAIKLDALDNMPVDIICFVLSPDSDGPYHLRRLSRVSRLLKSEELCQKLRNAETQAEIEALLINPEGWLLAA